MALAANRAEKLLKELQRLPCNKKCADCIGTGALGPSYVVLNFGTFVCTNCSSAQCAPGRRVSCTCLTTLCSPAQPLAEPPGEGHEHVHV